MRPLLPFLRARLSPEGYLGLHLTIGALLLIVASIAFGNIAEDVASAEAITLLDVQIAQWLHAHATPPLTHIMLWLTNMHGIAGISLMATGFGIWLVRRRDWYWLASAAIAVIGGMLLNVAMKYAFQRARPTFDEPLLTLATYSFPSGHTAGSTIFYGLLACYLIPRVQALPARAAIILLAVTMVLLVGLSRMYLGVHYFSDILGAISEGCAWLALTITAVSTLRRQRAWRAATMPRININQT